MLKNIRRTVKSLPTEHKHRCRRGGFLGRSSSRTIVSWQTWCPVYLPCTSACANAWKGAVRVKSMWGVFTRIVESVQTLWLKTVRRGKTACVREGRLLMFQQNAPCLFIFKKLSFTHLYLLLIYVPRVLSVTTFPCTSLIHLISPVLMWRWMVRRQKLWSGSQIFVITNFQLGWPARQYVSRVGLLVGTYHWYGHCLTGLPLLCVHDCVCARILSIWYWRGLPRVPVSK